MDRNAPMTITELGFLDFIGFASVKYTTVLEQNLGFSAFILKVLQCLHKNCRKRNPNEIMDYFVCTASECTCVDVMYFVPICTSAYHREKHTRLKVALNLK